MIAVTFCRGMCSPVLPGHSDASRCCVSDGMLLIAMSPVVLVWYAFSVGVSSSASAYNLLVKQTMAQERSANVDIKGSFQVDFSHISNPLLIREMSTANAPTVPLLLLTTTAEGYASYAMRGAIQSSPTLGELDWFVASLDFL